MAQPHEESPNIFTIRTYGEWLAFELSEVIAAVDWVYRALCIVPYYAKATETDNTIGALKNIRGIYALEGRFIEIRNTEAIKASVQSIDAHMQYSSDIIPASDMLELNKIHLASDGWISFKGLGEPFKQLRELIKDLWYRNSQQKALGEIEIITKVLELNKKYRLSQNQVFAIATRVGKHTKVIGRYIENGMITLEGEEPKSITKWSKKQPEKNVKGKSKT